MTLHAVVNLAESSMGPNKERPLNLDEFDHLRHIVGNSIDYTKVTVQSGGLQEWTNWRAHVVGNEIFLPEGL